MSILVAVVDPNHHKDNLQSWIEGYTGQKLTFNGTTAFTGLPKLGLRFENVSWRPKDSGLSSIGLLHAQTLHWWFAPHRLLTELSFGYLQIAGLDADGLPLGLPWPVNSPPEEASNPSQREEPASHPTEQFNLIPSLPLADQSLEDITLDLGPIHWQHTPFIFKAKVAGIGNGPAAKIRAQGTIFRVKSRTGPKATIEYLEVLQAGEKRLHSSLLMNTPCHIHPTRVRCTDFALGGSLARAALKEPVRFTITSPELLIDTQEIHAEQWVLKTQWVLADHSTHPCMRRIEVSAMITGEAMMDWSSREGYFQQIRGMGSVVPSNCATIPFTLTTEATFSLNPTWLTIPYLHVDLPEVTLNIGKGEGRIVVTDAVANLREQVYSLGSVDAVGHLNELNQQSAHIPLVASVDGFVFDEGLRTGVIRLESESFQALGIAGTARITGKRLLENPPGQFSLEHIKATGKLWGSAAAHHFTPTNVTQFSAIGTFIGNTQTGDYTLTPITLELVPPTLGRLRFSGNMEGDLTRAPLAREGLSRLGESPDALTSTPSSVLALTFNGAVHYFGQQTGLKQSSEPNQTNPLPEIALPSPLLSLEDEGGDKRISRSEQLNPHRNFGPLGLPKTERKNTGTLTSGSMMVVYNAHQLRLQDIDLAMDNVRTRGSFDAIADTLSPARFNFVIDQLNANRYLSPSIGAFLSKQLLSMRFPLRLPAFFFQKQNAEGQLIIDKLTLHDMAIDKLVLELQRDGELIINVGSLTKIPRH